MVASVETIYYITRVLNVRTLKRFPSPVIQFWYVDNVSYECIYVVLGIYLFRRKTTIMAMLTENHSCALFAGIQIMIIINCRPTGRRL